MHNKSPLFPTLWVGSWFPTLGYSLSKKKKKKIIKIELLLKRYARSYIKKRVDLRTSSVFLLVNKNYDSTSGDSPRLSIGKGSLVLPPSLTLGSGGVLVGGESKTDPPGSKGHFARTLFLYSRPHRRGGGRNSNEIARTLYE